MRSDESALLVAKTEVLGRAVVDDGGGLVGAEVLRGEDAGKGEVGVGGEVAEQGDVAVGKGARQE